MWKLSVAPKTVRVTKKLANEFATMEPAPHDRPLSERRLQVYGRMLSEGAFRPVSWARATCDETGGVYRVNGKHTSVLLSGLQEMPEFYVVIEDYACDTLEDVARLYATYDSRLQSRTSGNINGAFAATIKDFQGISSRCINLAVTGMAYHKWQNQYGMVPAAERAELMLEHQDYVLWLNDVVASGKEARHMKRGPVAAAMFGTFSCSNTAATEFWEAVRDETGPRPDLPDRKLARFLLTMAVNKGVGAESRPVHKADQREFYVKCIHAWNAWRKGEPTDLKYYRGAKIPAFG